ncbi:MAG: MFS transporter [Acidobacteriota bacterium]|nr:MFS transporter [Acidobacteriota bacterium]
MSPSPAEPSIAPAGRSLRARQTIALALLFAAGLVNFFDRSSLSIANTTVRAQMHLNATEMGWLLSAFSLAYGVAQLPLIGLLDRRGVRATLGFGLVLWSAAQLLTGFVRTLPQFLSLRVLLGVGEAPFYPAGVRSVREWFTPAARARATALMSSSQTIGLAIAPPVLAWIMLRVGWRAMFALLGVAGLAVAVVWNVLYRERARTDWAAVQPAPTAAPTAAPSPAAALKMLLGQRTAWGMMLGWGGVNYTVWLYLAWLPGYLQEQRHLSLARTGWVAAVPFLCGALGMFASGILSDARVRAGVPATRVHRVNIVTGMIASSASTWLVARSGSTTAAVAGIGAALFCIHFAGTSGWGYVQTVSPLEYVASLGALQNFAGWMIASTAPVLTGWLVDHTHSFNLALTVCSAVTLLGAVSYATLAAPHGRLHT